MTDVYFGFFSEFSCLGFCCLVVSCSVELISLSFLCISGFWCLGDFAYVGLRVWICAYSVSDFGNWWLWMLVVYVVILAVNFDLRFCYVVWLMIRLYLGLVALGACGLVGFVVVFVCFGLFFAFCGWFMVYVVAC